MITKGIILAGGTGSRLYPITKAVNKHLLPVYDKPMIYYPLASLLLAGIRDILLITTPNDLVLFQELLGDGKRLGISIRYATQQHPGGIPEAFSIGEKFIDGQRVALHLGDNILYGHGLHALLTRAVASDAPATIFAHRVNDPHRFGVVEFDRSGQIASLEEKPSRPRSNFAIVGLYFYGPEVVEYAKQLQPTSDRELQITDINLRYHESQQLHCEILGRGFAWLDMGTPRALNQAANFIETVEARQGLKLACIEEIACIKGYISASELTALGNAAKGDYGRYLIARAEEIAAGRK